jgi:8-oxo-dGTP diphosphatase
MHTTAPFCVMRVDSLFSKRRLATLIQKAPWIGNLAIFASRRLQPWTTVGVVGAVFNSQGQVLVVEHVFHPVHPWGLPGGWMGRNEDPEDTIRRELLEETSLQIEVIKPLVIMRSLTLRTHLDIAYLCHAAHGTDDLRLSSELLAYRWTDPAELPDVSIYNARVVRAALVEREILLR